MKKLYVKTEEFVIDSFKKADREKDIKHLQRTVFWVKQLKSNADESLLIAAVSHDIERAFRPVDYSLIAKKGFDSEEHLAYHQDKGSEIIVSFLRQQKASETIIKKVKALISKHEVGGDTDCNVLKDADSISFFENNANKFVYKIALEVGKEKVKSKLEWMFNRISDEKARRIASPYYEEAMQNLER